MAVDQAAEPSTRLQPGDAAAGGASDQGAKQPVTPVAVDLTSLSGSRAGEVLACKCAFWLRSCKRFSVRPSDKHRP